MKFGIFRYFWRYLASCFPCGACFSTARKQQQQKTLKTHKGIHDLIYHRIVLSYNTGDRQTMDEWVGEWFDLQFLWVLFLPRNDWLFLFFSPLFIMVMSFLLLLSCVCGLLLWWWWWWWCLRRTAASGACRRLVYCLILLLFVFHDQIPLGTLIS